MPIYISYDMQVAKITIKKESKPKKLKYKQTESESEQQNFEKGRIIVRVEVYSCETQHNLNPLL